METGKSSNLARNRFWERQQQMEATIRSRPQYLGPEPVEVTKACAASLLCSPQRQRVFLAAGGKLIRIVDALRGAGADRAAIDKP